MSALSYIIENSIFDILFGYLYTDNKNNMTRYSAFDIQLGKICEVCNKRSAKTVINAIRKIVANDCDINGLSDNEIFAGWGYILFSHTKRVVANNIVPLDYLGGYDEIRIILPETPDDRETSSSNIQ